MFGFSFNGCDGVRCKFKTLAKKMALTKPHLQFIHNLRVTSMQFVPTPWFPTLVSKKNLQGSPLGMGFPQCVRTSRTQGSTFLPIGALGSSNHPTRFRALGQQDPWQQFSGASRPRHLCLSLCVCGVFWLQEDWDRKVHKQEDEDVFLMGDSMLHQGIPMISTGLGEHSGPKSAGR